jgi:hypothetical protein
MSLLGTAFRCCAFVTLIVLAAGIGLFSPATGRASKEPALVRTVGAEKGWHPSTGACRSLHPTEVAAALGVTRVAYGGSGGQTGNQTPFELANASQCQWDALPNSNPYLILFIQPEATRATLKRLLQITGGPALGSRDCPRLRGVGSDACAGGSNLYTVQGRLGLTFTMIGPPGTKPHSVTYTHAEEGVLARKIFARVPFARR